MSENWGRAAAATPVIALHSSGATGRQWDVLAARLADLDVVAPDLHGHDGRTFDAAPGEILCADVARVGELLPASGPRGHLVGHSWGGAVALAAALAYPRRVASVTVYEPVLFGVLAQMAPAHWPPIRAVARDLEHGLAMGRPTAGARRFVDFWWGDGAWDAMPAPRRASVAARMPAVAAHFAALAAWCPATTELARLPALLHLAGSASPEPMRALASVLRARMPHAQFATMPAMGHMGPLTHAQTVAQRIERHVRARAAEANAGTRRHAA